MSKSLQETIHCMSPQLVVADLERSIRFYTEQLGFTLNFRHEGFYAGVECTGNSIHLKTGSPSGEEQARKRRNEDVDIVFGVTDLDGLYASVQAKGVEIIQPLREMPYGREFYLGDPDGYILSFYDVTK